MIDTVKINRKVGRSEGERHAAKIVMNGTRTRDTLSGRSLYVACAWTSRPAGAPLVLNSRRKIVTM